MLAVSVDHKFCKYTINAFRIPTNGNTNKWRIKKYFVKWIFIRRNYIASQQKNKIQIKKKPDNKSYS